MAERADRVPIQSILSPGRVTNVDAGKYSDMRQAMLASLPLGPPGITASELKQRVLPHLSPDLFPNGAKAGW